MENSSETHSAAGPSDPQNSESDAYEDLPSINNQITNESDKMIPIDKVWEAFLAYEPALIVSNTIERFNPDYFHLYKNLIRNFISDFLNTNTRNRHYVSFNKMEKAVEERKRLTELHMEASVILFELRQGAPPMSIEWFDAVLKRARMYEKLKYFQEEFDKQFLEFGNDLVPIRKIREIYENVKQTAFYREFPQVAKFLHNQGKCDQVCFLKFIDPTESQATKHCPPKVGDTTELWAADAFTEFYQKFVVKDKKVFYRLPLNKYHNFRNLVNNEMAEFFDPSKEAPYSLNLMKFKKAMDQGSYWIQGMLGKSKYEEAMKNKVRVTKKEFLDNLDKDNIFEKLKALKEMLDSHMSSYGNNYIEIKDFKLDSFLRYAFFKEFPKISKFIHNQGQCEKYGTCCLHFVDGDSGNKCENLPSYAEVINVWDDLIKSAFRNSQNVIEPPQNPSRPGYLTRREPKKLPIYPYF